MSRTNDRAVMLVIERGATEIDEPDVGSFHASHVSPLKKKELLLKHFRNGSSPYTPKRSFGSATKPCNATR